MKQHNSPADLRRTLRLERGDQLFAQAGKRFVGGAGSAGRLFPALGRQLFLERADGPFLYDVDGNRYIDYHSSSGATFLGYNNPRIRAALERGLAMGWFCNFETEHHLRLAELICDSVPCAEKVRFANTGTEATLAAIRLARAVTGRKRIIKFEGHFHGMHEMVWYNSRTPLPEPEPNGEIPLIPDSAGIPEEIGSLVTVLPFNEPQPFVDCLRRRKGEIAAVIMEPVMYNAGCIHTDPAFLRLVRERTAQDGIVLIFDEVLSGFRMALGGGQEYLGVTPDLATLGKALGGSGLPIAALVGKDWVMKGLNPVGKTVVSGTYTGHILEVLGAVEAMNIMREPGFYEGINALASRLYEGMQDIFERSGKRVIVEGIGARFAVYFGLERRPVTRYREVVRGFDFESYTRFILECFARKLYLHDYGSRIAPSHHGFTSMHTEGEIDETLSRMEDALKAM